MSVLVKFSSKPELLDRWVKRARESQLSHHLMAERLDSQHKWLGLLVIVITSVSGATAIIAELKGNDKLWLGLITLLVTVLTAFQTFLKLEEKANRHRVAAAGYGDVRRMLELASVSGNLIVDKSMTQAEVAMGNLAKESPSVSKRIYDSAMKRAN
ncbi:SLATT domain-containing protein [Pseudomonas yamanorum]|uniref:SLATT domain-containing protein n=1 Tax=Pseudomonas yamanorum TaxID=515393 RepID=UPI0015A11044|nr:SLATT domain-containing protein [Pseudomonas yamanorum]NVZ84727.1 SLATT domain-containing protein [Pseudomonas yamanorum]